MSPKRGNRERFCFFVASFHMDWGEIAFKVWSYSSFNEEGVTSYRTQPFHSDKCIQRESLGWNWTLSLRKNIGWRKGDFFSSMVFWSKRENWGDVEDFFERLYFPPPKKKEGGITCYRPFLMVLIARISRPKMKVGCSCCFSHCSAKPL